MCPKWVKIVLLDNTALGSTCRGFTSEAQLRKLGQAPTETIGMSRQVYTLSLENLNPTSGGHASPR